MDELLSAKVDAIAFACTAGSFFEGADGEETLRERLRGGSQIEAVTTAGAVAGALRALDAQRVAMVTPYIPELNDLEVKFLHDWGFDVVSQAGMSILTAFDIGVVPLEETYRFAREHTAADADALFISCTNLRTMDVIQALEEDLGIPVCDEQSSHLLAVLAVARSHCPDFRLRQVVRTVSRGAARACDRLGYACGLIFARRC